MQSNGLEDHHMIYKGVIPVDKQKLNQYRVIQREKPKLKREIEKLYTQLDAVPEVAGKVTRSSKEFPYIKSHATVRMAEPKQATVIKERIREKENRLKTYEKIETEVKNFITSIDDITVREIFELMYLGEKRMSQRKVGELIGYDQSSVSLKIDKYLKDS